MTLTANFNKSAIAALVLLCASVTLKGQDQDPKPMPNYVLKTAETGATKNYVARDSISLQPGFSYTATQSTDGSDKKTFSAKVDNCILFPPTDNTYLLADGTYSSTIPAGQTGTVVGSIPGQFAVSPTGAATYSIPIEVPAGINGMQPNISLVYNSQAGNGIAGWGWNIGGISMISRVPRTIYYDGVVSGIDWTKDSPLALDGQRLIKISDTEYRTENESFSKITAKNIQTWGPEEIEVQTKDGLLMTYGNKDDFTSYSPLMASLLTGTRRQGWLLKKVTDHFGNYVAYSYSMRTVENLILRSNRFYDHVISAITYGNSQCIVASVGFYYNERTDVNIGYVDGHLRSNSKLLEKIEVNSGGELYRQYNLKYQLSDLYNQLLQVEMTNGEGEKLKPIIFNWSNDKFSSEISDNVSFYNSPLMTQWLRNEGYKLDYFRHQGYGDIDGDGDLDFLVSIRVEKTVRSGSWPFYSWKDYENKSWAVYLNNGTSYTCIHEEMKDVDENTLVFLDNDNDGLDELYIFNPKAKDENAYVRRYNYNAANQQLDKSYVVHGNLSLGRSVNNSNHFAKSAIPVNLTGDGYVHWACFGENNTLYDDKENVCFGGERSSGLFLIDYNRNGVTDFLYINSSTSYVYEYNLSDPQNLDADGNWIKNDAALKFTFPAGAIVSWDNVYPGDYNGDGNSDILVFDRSEKKWFLWISTGFDYFSRELDKSIADLLPLWRMPFEMMVIDINKDGKSDIVSSTPLVENGTESSSKSNLNLILGHGNCEFKLVDSKEIVQYYGEDLRGYGKYTNVNDNGIIVNKKVNSHVYRFGKDLSFSKINGFSDSFGNSITVSYGRLGASFYKNQVSPLLKNSNDEENSFGGMPEDYFVVSGMQGKLLDQTYKFTEPQFHRQGKGFVGFGSIENSDNILGFKTSTKSRYDSSRGLLVPETNTVNSLTNDLIATTSSNISAIPFGDGTKRYWTKTYWVKSTDHLKGVETTEAFSEYDSYGNPQTVTTDFGNGISNTQSLRYVNAGSWCANKLESLITTSTNSIGSFETEKRFEYYSTGKLKKETLNPQKGKFEVVTDYIYDGFGNVTNIDVTNNGELRSTEMTYTPSGRFIETTKNVQLGQKVTYEYDDVKALLTRETNHIGPTTYNYDGFGRLVKTKSPDHLETTTLLQWSDGTGPNGACYYSYSETSGQAPVKVWYDSLNREIRRDFYGLKDRKLLVTTEYDTQGRVWRVSEPYFEGATTSTVFAAITLYDNYGRVDKVTAPAGITTYDYSKPLEVKVTTPLSVSITKTNAVGQTTESNINGKSVSYTYWPSGQVKTATPKNGLPVETDFDLNGNRIKLVDPDAGITTSEYNGWGQLVWSEQRKSVSDTIASRTDLLYHPKTGLLESETIRSESASTALTTTYKYNSLHQLEKVSIPGVHSQVYEYDALGRTEVVTETIGADRSYTFATQYDAFGRVAKEIYPSGYYVVNQFNGNGVLTSVTDVKGKTIWEATDENARGQLTACKVGGRELKYGYTPKGQPESIFSNGIIHMTYKYKECGHLWWRTDHLTKLPYSQREVFEFDELSRLSKWDIYWDFLNNYGDLKKANNIAYDAALGNIETKSDIGFTMKYGENGQPPHALTSIAGNPESISDEAQNIKYTPFHKFHTITEGDYKHTLTYGVDRQRRKGMFKQNNKTTLTRYYLGDYEEEVKPDGSIRKIHYISAGNGLSAIYVQNGADSLYFCYTDYQGNLLAVTDDKGKIVERLAYDPWGARRNPTDWTQPDSRSKHLFARGYTMHEHLSLAGATNGGSLINMNGRLYDPMVARFLSPDPFIQAPDNWGNFNRYGYCLNNPLMYSDPSGEYALVDDLVVMAVGGLINLGVSAIQGNVNSWGQAGGYFLSGAAAAETTIYAGPVAGGAVLAMGNDLTSQISNDGLKKVNFAQTTFAGCMGGATAYAGGVVTGWVSPYVSGLTSKIASPVIQKSLTQSVTNATSGFAIGTGFSLLSGNDLQTSLGDGGQGALSGFGLGLMTGIVSGMHYSKKHGLDPWSGKSKWRTEPVGVQEQMALDAAKRGAGEEIMKGEIKDKYWKGYQKMQYTSKGLTGNVTIHYWRNPLTGTVSDFKFTTKPIYNMYGR